MSPIISPREVPVKPSQREIIQPEKIETEVPDEPDVYHSPVSPLHYPENNSRERCEKQLIETILKNLPTDEKLSVIFYRSPKLQHTIVTKAISLKRPKPIRPKSNKSSYEAYDEQAIPAQRLYVFILFIIYFSFPVSIH